MMCALVIGGNGSVAIPPSVAPIASSSITAGILFVLKKFERQERFDVIRL
jgi:hypothetical protein